MKNRILEYIKKHILEITALTIFIALIPLCTHVTYWQNDEGIFYGNVVSFMNGNYKLHRLTAPTFYAQGFLAVAFSKLFGFSKIPYLTLLVSVGSYYVLCKIFKDRFNKSSGESIFLSLYLLFNPLFAYSAFGFMTENYFLFFFLCSLYFYFGKSARDFIFANIVTFIAYMTRQLALVLPLANIIYLFSRKCYKKAFIQLFIFIALVIFHYYIFPKTPEMFENSFKFSRISFFRYSFSLIFVIAIYLASLLLPILISYLYKAYKESSKKALIITIVISTLAVVFSFIYFKPSLIWHDIFYYLINILQRNGFYLENMHGIKPRFAEYGGFYSVWDVLSKIAAVLLLVLIIKKKETFNLNIIIIAIYSFMLLISPKIHDRYLLPMFPVVLIFLTEKIKLSKLSIYVNSLFLLFLAIYSYNFTMDYVYTNEYVWNRSKDITTQKLTEPGEIVSTALWNFSNPSVRKSYDYKFTYDPPSSPEYKDSHELVEVKSIKYPFDFWGNINVYLYKLKH